MALTAARTELNVSLVGEDETIRMLEDAKRRMGELEAKTRTLTGATQAQTEAAKAQQVATIGVNDRLKGLAERAEGVVGGVDKVKGAFEKVIGVAGFLGSAVTGIVTGINFLVDAFDDSAEEAAKQAAQLEETKKKTDALKESTDKLTASLVSFQAVTRGAGAALAGQRAQIAALQGDTKRAAQEGLNAEAEAAKASAAALREKKTEAEKAQRDTTSAEIQARYKVQKAEEEIAKLRKGISLTEEGSRNAIFSSHREQAKERRKELQRQMAAAEAALRPEREALALATKAREEGEKALGVLHEQVRNEERIAQLRKERAEAGVKEELKPEKTGGGGGGARRGPTEDEAEAMRNELLWLRSDADERARVIKTLYEEQLAREAVDEAMRQATKTARDELTQTLPELQKRIQADLATLPAGATFEAVRKQLAEQLKAVNEQMAELKALSGLEDADLLALATDKQLESLSKLEQAYLSLGEARAKAFEESEKMREAMARALPAEIVTNFTTGLEQLSQMQAPVFEAVQESLAGVSAQMAKFKEGQTSLASAIVGSASAIAGAVAKKVGGVKAEAGVRAAFEVAMGIATAFTNPAESLGHFAAATAFGLLAGGKVVSTDARASGGQKAPAKAAATTRESGMGGGGGSITNVYNLQTGIVDGQSTAMAFRRAEMTARNTGMASAGGW